LFVFTFFPLLPFFLPFPPQTPPSTVLYHRYTFFWPFACASRYVEQRPRSSENPSEHVRAAYAVEECKRDTDVRWRNGGLNGGCMEVEKTGKHRRTQTNAVWAVKLGWILKEKEAWKWKKNLLVLFLYVFDVFFWCFIILSLVYVLNDFNFSLYKTQVCRAVWMAVLVLLVCFYKSYSCEVR
jgi:hypothetical protein